LLALAISGIAFSASAADLPVKAREAPAAIVVSNWAGWYFGGNVGYGVGQISTTESAVAGPASIIVGEGTSLYGGPKSQDLTPHGVNGGVQLGYNWQVTPLWVLGFETDFQASDMKRTANCVLPCGTPIAITSSFVSSIFPVTFSDNSISTKLDYFGTVRGRFGYSAGPALFYVTGGFAYGEVERRASVAGTTNVIFGGQINTFAGSYSAKSTQTGWTIGGGVEGKLWGNWSAKAEYLYIDLGSVTDSFNTVFLTSAVGQTGQVAAHRTVTTDIRENIFRVGLNYRFAGLGY
jgi:outer membrane immunogenic protein